MATLHRSTCATITPVPIAPNRARRIHAWGVTGWAGIFLVVGGWLLVGPWTSGQATANEPTDAVMIEAEGEAARWWPQWRGPTRQGVQQGNYPDRWSDTENVVWKTPLPGEGNSSPIVWRDRIFLTTSHDRGRRRSIVGLDRNDGRLLWETPAPEAEPESSNGRNGHATSTAVTDGQRVYAYLGNSGLLCVDLDGQQLWHTPIVAIQPKHGIAGSPLLHRGKLIIYQEDRRRENSFIAAYDAETGQLVWRTERSADCGWGSPIAVRVDGREEIIVNSQRQVMAYHPDTGELLWTCKGTTSEVTPTPVVGHGLVFCSAGRAGPTLAIRPGGEGDVTETHVAWQTGRGSPFVPSPVLHEGRLYMINDNVGVVSCYDAPTGELVWQGRLESQNKLTFYASPVIVDGKLFITTEEGETFVLATGPKLEVLHVNNIGERTSASPAVVDDRWYIRTRGHLVCIGHD